MAKAQSKSGKSAGGKASGGGAKSGSGGSGGGGAERGETQTLVVGTKVKDVVKAQGCMSSAELLEAISVKVHEMLLQAAHRAKENGRSTVRPYDL